MVDFSAVIKRT